MELPVAIWFSLILSYNINARYSRWRHMLSMFCLVFVTNTERKTRQIGNRNRAAAVGELFCPSFRLPTPCRPPTHHIHHSPHKISPNHSGANAPAKLSTQPTSQAPNQPNSSTHPSEAQRTNPPMTHKFPLDLKVTRPPQKLHFKIMFYRKCILIITSFVSFWI